MTKRTKEEVMKLIEQTEEKLDDLWVEYNELEYREDLEQGRLLLND